MYIPASADTATPGERLPLTSYQKRLFFFLSVATFFEGYDYLALTQLLPSLQKEFQLTESGVGWMVGVINIGTVLAYFVIRQADRFGRRAVLTVTILGYTLFSILTGLCHGVVLFAVFQLLARIFLIAEWAISMVYAAEEYPANRRGMVIGVIQASSSLGAITCAAVVPAILRSPLGWQGVYLLGGIPLLLIAFARRNLKETARFEAQGPQTQASPLFHIFSTPYRNRMLLMASIWGLTYACTQNAVTFWKQFATEERGLTHGQIGWMMSLAAVISLPMLFGTGYLLDRLGRRLGALIIFTVTSVGIFCAYTLHSQVGLGISLALCIYGCSAVLPVLNAFTAELFPTSVRGDGFAWSNNLLGRLMTIPTPVLIGTAAGAYGWGPSVAATVILPMLALALILRFLPETGQRELEDTSAVEGTST